MTEEQRSIVQEARRRVRWFAFWLFAVAYYIPLTVYVYSLVGAFIISSHAAMPGWAMGPNLATCVTVLKWWLFAEMAGNGRSSAKPMRPTEFVKSWIFAAIALVTVGRLVHTIRGSPSWTEILVYSISVPSSFIVAYPLLKHSNYSRVAAETTKLISG